MRPEHLEANEQFFEMIFKTLAEGGKYVFPEIVEVYTKKDGKLHCSKKGYLEIKKIVTPQYLIKRFIAI
jgi:hypothetical protein